MPKLITDPEKIRLREEEEIQALLGRPPSRLTKWGITVVAGCVLLLLIIGQKLRYPDIVEAPAVIQTESPVIRLEAKMDGRIEQLWVTDSQRVDSGQLLVQLEDPAPLNNVRTVKTLMPQLLQAIEQKSIASFELPQDLLLAALQTPYAELSGLLDSQKYLLAKDDAGRKIALYNQQLDQLDAFNDALSQEMKTQQEAVQLARRNFDIFADLKKKGGAGELTVEEARTKYLSARQSLEAMQRDSINNRLKEQDLRNAIITLSQEQSNEIKRGWVQLTGAVRQLQGEIVSWEDLHLIRAPLAGQVILSKVRSRNESVNKGETVLAIDPGYGQSRIVARADLPVARAGKVQPAQRALLRLQSYPYKQFGVLEGKVENVAPLPESENDPAQEFIYYPMLIALDTDSLLITSADSTILFRQELRATARIITADRSFLERILDEVLSVFREN